MAANVSCKLPEVLREHDAFERLCVHHNMAITLPRQGPGPGFFLAVHAACHSGTSVIKENPNAFTTLTFLVRLLVLVLTLPLICTAAFVGLIDGLVRRDVRRFGAGRESGFIYHRAKASLMPLAVLPWVTYLALPISVHPLLILLPSAALLGLAVSLTAGSFKKYL